MGGHVDISYCGAGPWIFIAGAESLLTKELISRRTGPVQGVLEQIPVPSQRVSGLWRRQNPGNPYAFAEGLGWA